MEQNSYEVERDMPEDEVQLEQAIKIERFNTLHQVGEWLEHRAKSPPPDNINNDFNVKITGKDILTFKDGKLPG